LDDIPLPDGVRLIPFQPMHRHAIELTALEAHSMSTLEQTGQAPALFEIQAASPSFTGIINGKVVACGGATHCYPGVAEMWLLADACLYTYAIRRRFWAVFPKVIEALAKEMDLVRAQCVVLSQFHTSVRMMQRLYFEKEGLLRKASPTHKDLFVMARLFK